MLVSSVAPPALAAPGDQPQDHVPRLVESRLRQTSYSALRSVTCQFHEGTATLHGMVPSFYLKQLAQTLARQVNEVRQVVNRIEVAPWDASDEEHRRG